MWKEGEEIYEGEFEEDWREGFWYMKRKKGREYRGYWRGIAWGGGRQRKGRVWGKRVGRREGLSRDVLENTDLFYKYYFIRL